jgi:hypothetical protein
MASTLPLGYKPQTACWLLNVGGATFRYWRENIEPHPRRKSFSAGDILAFRIIKVLIYKKHLSADLLSLFSFSMIFSTCSSRSLDELTNQYLLLDESNYSIRFFSLKHAVDPYNLDLHVLRLASVIEDHQKAFCQLGNLHA